MQIDPNFSRQLVLKCSFLEAFTNKYIYKYDRLASGSFIPKLIKFHNFGIKVCLLFTECYWQYITILIMLGTRKGLN